MCCQGKEPQASWRAGLFKLNLVNSELNSVKTNKQTNKYTHTQNRKQSI